MKRQEVQKEAIMNSEQFHYGQVIRFFRLQRGMSVTKLASL
ncbi:MAG TPA: hypothetical protein VK140_01760 [Ktedonobacteraceae bacterium]|nr:hypothetical protein [Ktedonobacteraceae bacterium]